MYNLSFMEEIEEGMKSLLAKRDRYVNIKTLELKIQEEIKKIYFESEKIEDKESNEYKELIEQARNVKERYYNLHSILEKEEKRFENIKQYILRQLKINKAILEKYRDVNDDKDINYIKGKPDEFDIKKVEQRLVEVSGKMELNDISAEETKNMNPEELKKVKEAKEQYLNNKKEFEKLTKIKYVSLLGKETPKKRIFQYESAIAEIEKNFSIENIEDVISKLEVTLGIEKQRPQIKFNAKTHTYTYIDERGKETSFPDMFEKEQNGKYKSKLTDLNKKSTIQYAKEKGLSRRQIKAIDYNVINILGTKNPNLMDNYLEAIKEGKEADFDIEYDLRIKGIKKEEKLDRKILRTIKNVANKQRAKGMANVIKDKSRGKLYGILTALGVSGLIGGYKVGLQMGAPVNEKTNTEATLENDNTKTDNNIRENSDISGKDDEMLQNSKLQKEENDKKTNISLKNKEETTIESKTDGEINFDDYVKISKGAMLFRNSTDWMRMKNGLNANERVQIKNSSSDKLYKITKIAYCSPDGTVVAIDAGQDLEETLKAKGLDRSFIEDENTIVMYHTVAEGIAQWVNEDDVEKAKVEVDKLGNVVDKTEEQKIVDEAVEKLNDTKQQASTIKDDENKER